MSETPIAPTPPIEALPAQPFAVPAAAFEAPPVESRAAPAAVPDAPPTARDAALPYVPRASVPPPAVPVPAVRRPPREIPVLGEESAMEPLQQIRDLLVDTLRLDAPVFSARMFVRVRNARTAADLIDLVWEIQDRLARARHAHRELHSLQLARDLLGLGNTMVAEEPTASPDDDD